jgi:hypothetical protein
MLLQVDTVSVNSGVKFPEAEKVRMKTDLVRFQQLLEDVGEHTKYDIFTWNPSLFDCTCLEAVFANDRVAQATAAGAKRAVLDLWGHLSWWISSVDNWKDGMSDATVENIMELDLLTPPK